MNLLIFTGRIVNNPFIFGEQTVLLQNECLVVVGTSELNPQIEGLGGGHWPTIGDRSMLGIFVTSYLMG
jgi:hypothetical protein